MQCGVIGVWRITRKLRECHMRRKWEMKVERKEEELNPFMLEDDEG